MNENVEALPGLLDVMVKAGGGVLAITFATLYLMERKERRDAAADLLKILKTLARSTKAIDRVLGDDDDS